MYDMFDLVDISLIFGIVISQWIIARISKDIENSFLFFMVFAAINILEIKLILMIGGMK